jgi:hypothetical protein
VELVTVSPVILPARTIAAAEANRICFI